jgi:hypothetical protein
VQVSSTSARPRLERKRLASPIDLRPLEREDLRLHAPPGEVGEADYPAQCLEGSAARVASNASRSKNPWGILCSASMGIAERE